jgi:hypothetical protein
MLENEGVAPGKIDEQVGKTRFWVAQRFQRCDKVFFSRL